jgi:hypothetical protein
VNAPHDPPTPDEVVGAYADLRARVVDVLRSSPVEAGGHRVPHCPGWTVSELVSHIVGVPEDVLAGRMEGVTTEAWTNRQVERHRGRSLGELADVLDALGPSIDMALRGAPARAREQLVMDAVTHEHDLRRALGVEGAHDSVAVRIGAAWLLVLLESLDAELGRRVAAIDLTPFERLRALGGRLSVDEMDALGLPGRDIAAALAGTPLRPPPTAVS